MTASDVGGARALDPTILRAYDIRGIVGTTLSAPDAEAIGRALAGWEKTAAARSSTGTIGNATPKS